MLGFLQSPTAETIVLVYVAFYIISAAVQSIPNPSVFGGVWYAALYNFLTILIADFKSFASKSSTFSALSTTTATSGPSGIITVDKTAILSGGTSSNQPTTSSTAPSYTGGDFIRQNSTSASERTGQ